MRASTQKARGFFPGMRPGLRLFGVREQDSAAPSPGQVPQSRGGAQHHCPSAFDQANRVGELNPIEIDYIARANRAVNDSGDQARQSSKSGGFRPPLTPMATLAAIDRVVHHSVVLDLMAVESFRAKAAGAKSKTRAVAEPAAV